jgi:beta-glucosidase-like glycosyl hydrolase
VVTDLGRAAVEGLLAGGVAPVIKHVPGHGAPGPTATRSCRWWTPRWRSSSGPISRPSGR